MIRFCMISFGPIFEFQLRNVVPPPSRAVPQDESVESLAGKSKRFELIVEML